MYGVIRAELINGSGFHRSPRPHPWVAQITGFHQKYKFNRVFMDGVYDYSFARKSGGRGIYIYYALPPGVYDVYYPISWKHEDRYYALVDDDGNITRISKEDVEQWLNQQSAD